MANTKFYEHVLAWYDLHGRKTLPWKINATPYHVWISEIMLQQTQVATVISYYQNFIAHFPNIESLANAAQDDVLKLWTGLGYYSRARNLHKAAKIMISDFKAQLPTSIEELMLLPGIGRSTAGAILSLGHGISAPICDGNVKRVLGRYFAIDGWPGQGKILKNYWQAAEKVTPAKRCGDFNQAMMDLGSMICTRTKPNCDACPVQNDCTAFNTHSTDKYPGKKPKNTKPRRVEECLMLLACDGDHILFEQRPSYGIWGGLWCLPMFETSTALTSYVKQQQWHTDYDELEPLTHEFSHFTLHIQPVLVEVNRCHQVSGNDTLRWCQPGRLPGGTCKPVLTILGKLLKT